MPSKTTRRFCLVLNLIGVGLNLLAFAAQANPLSAACIITNALAVLLLVSEKP